MKKGERTRQLILEQAAAVFNRKGYEGSSMSDLTEATRIQKGGLYRHFESKEQLALEAFQYAFRKAQEARWHVPVAGEPQLQVLLGFIERFVDPAGPLVPGGCPILNTAVDADDGNELLLQAVQAELKGWLERLAAQVEAGVASGEFRACDSKAVAAFLIGSLEGALMISRVQRDRDVLKRSAQFLGEWLERTLLP
jgi:TetR/AcrR family transcriptional repressor of nem operon